MESELVSGFMTEHAAVVFVFFFLAEYGSIVLMCILTSLLFLGGYLPIYSISYLISLIDYIYFELFFDSWLNFYGYSSQYVYEIANNPSFYFIENRGPAQYYIEYILNNPNLEGLLYGLTLGLKSSIMIFCFIWTRAAFPRIRFDRLMTFCWTVLLPILFAFIILIPCILHSFDITPTGNIISLMCLPSVLIRKSPSTLSNK